MKRALLICIVLLACAGGGICLFLSLPGTPKAAAAPPTPPTPSASGAMRPLAEPVRKDPVPVSPLGDDVPAWARRSDAAGKAPGSAAPDRDAAAGSRVSPEVKAATQRLAALQSKKDLTPREVAAALGDIEKAHGSPIVGGVRLDVLRQNLLVADEMKTVSEELQAMQRAGVLQTAEGRARFQEKVRQIEEIRGRMQMDFGVPPAPALAAGKTGPAP